MSEADKIDKVMTEVLDLSGATIKESENMLTIFERSFERNRSRLSAESIADIESRITQVKERIASMKRRYDEFSSKMREAYKKGSET